MPLIAGFTPRSADLLIAARRQQLFEQGVAFVCGIGCRSAGAQPYMRQWQSSAHQPIIPVYGLR
jgi:hypothetical protein